MSWFIYYNFYNSDDFALYTRSLRFNLKKNLYPLRDIVMMFVKGTLLFCKGIFVLKLYDWSVKRIIILEIALSLDEGGGPASLT
jgi:hypothetical protein